MDAVFRALADPSRRLLLDRLYEDDGQTLGALVAALPGMTPESLYLLLDQRELGSLDVVRARLGTAASYATLSSSNANRITVDVRFDNKHEMRSEAVVLLLKDDTEPYRLLSWSDEIGTSTKDGGGNTSLR